MSFRKEIKLRLNKSKIYSFKDLLSSRGAETIYPKRIVSSLYFDTNNKNCYKDSIEGVIPRKKLEARVLMMSTNNILHPASGEPIIVPSQDIVLGLYYLSQMKKGEPGEGKTYDNINELNFAIENGSITLHSKINYRLSEGESDRRTIETTPGRVIISKELPDNENVKFDIVNKLLTKKAISRIIA